MGTAIIGMHPLVFFGIVILPYVMMAAAMAWGMRTACRSKSPAKPLFIPALAVAFAVTAAVIVWGQYCTAISLSRSSTAAVAYFFLPFISLEAGLIAFLVTGAALYVLRFILERTTRLTPRLTSPVLLMVAIVILSATAFTVQQKLSRHKLFKAAKTATFEKNGHGPEKQPCTRCRFCALSSPSFSFLISRLPGKIPP